MAATWLKWSLCKKHFRPGFFTVLQERSTWTAESVFRRWGSCPCTGRKPPDLPSWQSIRNSTTPSLNTGRHKTTPTTHNVSLTCESRMLFRSEAYLSISWSLSIRSIQATPQYMPFILRNSDIAYSKSSGSWPYLNRVESKREPEARTNWTWQQGWFKENHPWTRSLLCYESSMLVKQKRSRGTLGHICILHNNSHSWDKLWNEGRFTPRSTPLISIPDSAFE